MQTVRVQKDFTAPPEEVFDYLSEHENLSVVFAPAKVTRIREGDTEPNGVGSVRKLSVFGAMPFEETVVASVVGERIEYKVTKGTPLRDHHGTMLFSPTGAGGTHLDYTITFDAAVPGLAAVVAAGLRRNIAKGLAKVDDSL